MRDAVLVYFQLPPRMFKTLGAAPRRGAARGRPFSQVAHAPEPFQRCRRVLRPDIEALGVELRVGKEARGPRGGEDYRHEDDHVLAGDLKLRALSSTARWLAPDTI